MNTEHDRLVRTFVEAHDKSRRLSYELQEAESAEDRAAEALIFHIGRRADTCTVRHEGRLFLVRLNIGSAERVGRGCIWEVTDYATYKDVPR